MNLDFRSWTSVKREEDEELKFNILFFPENREKSFPFRSNQNVFTNVKVFILYSYTLVLSLTFSQFILASVK